MIGAFVLVLFVSGAVVLETPIFNASSNTGSASNGPVNVPPFPSEPITLYSVAHVEQVVKAKVLLPNISALGPGFQIVGAYIAQPPTNTPQSNAPSYLRWVLNFYITNETFVNGTTLNTDLLARSTLITESNLPVSAYSSTSQKHAEDFINGGQFCIMQSNANASAMANATVTSMSSCTSKPNANENLIQIRSTYLAVDQTTPSALFEISGTNIGVEIYPGGPPGAVSTAMSYQQMLALAGSMIP